MVDRLGKGGVGDWELMRATFMVKQQGASADEARDQCTIVRFGISKPIQAGLHNQCPSIGTAGDNRGLSKKLGNKTDQKRVGCL